MSDPVKRFVSLTEDDIETIQHALNCAHSTGDVDSREASEISNRLESAPEITKEMIERGAEVFWSSHQMAASISSWSTVRAESPHEADIYRKGVAAALTAALKGGYTE